MPPPALLWPQAGCEHDEDACPAALSESFNPLGSWSFAFGLGAAAVTALLLALLAASRLAAGRALPSLEFGVRHAPSTRTSCSHLLCTLRLSHLPFTPFAAPWPHLQVMRVPGSIAGLLWVIGEAGG